MPLATLKVQGLVLQETSTELQLTNVKLGLAVIVIRDWLAPTAVEQLFRQCRMRAPAASVMSTALLPPTLPAVKFTVSFAARARRGTLTANTAAHVKDNANSRTARFILSGSILYAQVR